MKTLILIISVVSLALSAHEEINQRTIDLLLQKVRAELPKGWSASYEEEFASLSVQRDEQFLAKSMAPNSDPGQEPMATSFSFGLRVTPKLDPAEHRRLSSENARMAKEAHDLRKALLKKRLAHKFDSFQGKTEEDKRMIERYENLKNSRHLLSDYTFKDIGLYWYFNSPNWPMFYAEDERIRQECDLAYQKVIKLLSPAGTD